MKKISILIALLLIGPYPVLAAKEFSVLTWNLLLLPSLVKSTFHDARLPRISEKLATSSYDFIFLQEVFTSSGYSAIAKTLQAKGYYSTGYPHRDFFKPVNSGIVTFSKYPLSEIESIPLKGMTGSDFFSSKAIVSAKAKISDNLTIQLVNTHLQSRQNDKSVLIRKIQLTQLEEGFKKVDPSLNIPLIFAGDLNIDRNFASENKSLTDFVAKYKFNTVLPENDIKNTVDCSTNVLKSFIDPNCTYIKYLDYIFASFPLKVDKLKVLEQRESYLMEGKKRNLPLSDHYAVEAIVKI